MTGRASDRWRRLLEEWAIPQELLDAVSDSPYGWSTELWKRRTQTAREQGFEPPTGEVVRSLLGSAGTLLDVGAGTGRASLLHAADGHRLTAVEKDSRLAAEFRQRANELGIAALLVEGVWPDVEDEVSVDDVAMCANVVYDVQEIEPFMAALSRHGRGGVVIELTVDHPWSSLAPYYRALHHLERPQGPTYEDLVEVVQEVCGVRPEVEVWTRPGQTWFESWDEILDHYGQRLVLPPRRRGELEALLAPEIEVDGGRIYVGTRERTMVTVWWRNST
jgi:SAM-dependent methyltransferase